MRGLGEIGVPMVVVEGARRMGLWVGNGRGGRVAGRESSMSLMVDILLDERIVGVLSRVGNSLGRFVFFA